MSQTAFIHAADIHLDSPLDNLRRLDPTTAARLQRASRRSLETLVAAALEHRVSAVAIAGDLFDGPVKDAGAGLWVESQFKRLTREGIRVILIRGNHDWLSNARRVIRWSEGIHELSSEQAESLLLEDVGLAFHGQSFAARVVNQDLASAYPAATRGYFNVGLLHTSLAGSPQHDTYAPTSVALLESKGYQYWALGHIHIRNPNSLSERCFVGYSGNTQGRHIREPGPKGCQLVRVQDGQLQSLQFIPTDSLRWHELRLNIEGLEMLSDIEDLLQQSSASLHEMADGRPLAVRLRLEGPSGLHAALTQSSTLANLTDVLAARLRDVGDIWFESLRLSTQPAQSMAMADMALPLQYVCRVAQETRQDAGLQAEMLELLEELFKKARSELSEAAWPLVQPEQQQRELTRLLQRAEDLLVARLMTGATE